MRSALAFACLMILATLPLAIAPARAANVSFLLTASTSGWIDSSANVNPTLFVDPGDVVTVTIERLDSSHNWALYPPGSTVADVSFDNPLALHRTGIVNSPGETSPVTFTLNTSGTYEYFCEFHASPMHGQLIVRSTGANLPPSVTVNAPTSAASWSGGSTHDVSFDVLDDEPASNLTAWVNYTYNAGAAGGPISGPIPVGPNPNRVSWTVPATNATDVIVNVTVEDGRAATSSRLSNPFEVDSTKPAVAGKSPDTGATGVSLNAPVVVTWSEGMNRIATTAAGAFGLLNVAGGVWTQGAFSWSPDSRVVTFSPTAPFAASTTYRVHANATALDDSNPGNPPLVPEIWTFMTGTAADTTDPAISSASADPSRQVSGGFVNITASITDDNAVTSVRVHVVGPSFDQNLTMIRSSGTVWYANANYTAVGSYSYTIWAFDSVGNFASQTGSFEIIAPSAGFALDALTVGAVVLIAVALVALALLLSRRRRTPPRA
ncbi:MAG TPA: Ig-like domain-containing protein [Thermoplasmata archaeon]|nr:Ig-like domain-containing protein [Thermoplasmata archaeon]